MSVETNLDRAAPRVDGVLRLCRCDDLRRLEWFGAFTVHRQIIAETFAMQERGEGLMLVCDVRGFPVGQVWIKFSHAQPKTARLWALRVMEPYQSRGIGERLIRHAETILAERQFCLCEIGVYKENTWPQRLYERLGYRLSHALTEPFTYVTPSGEIRREIADQWILCKCLSPRL
jgi:GNAT superfamily N-acetyltransferase